MKEWQRITRLYYYSFIVNRIAKHTISYISFSFMIDEYNEVKTYMH